MAKLKMDKIEEMFKIARENGNFNELMRLQKIKQLNNPKYKVPSRAYPFRLSYTQKNRKKF